MSDHPCPKCGHCPTCGRSNAPYGVWPYPWGRYPWPTTPYQPWSGTAPQPRITYWNNAAANGSAHIQHFTLTA